MSSFSSILDTPSSQVERPKPLPQGTYIWTVKGQPRFDKNQKGTEFVEFTLVPSMAYDDVDETELEEAGGIADKATKLTFYVTEKSLYRLKEFVADCGIDVDVDGVSLRSLAEQTANSQVVGTIKHTPSNDGKGIYANIASTAKVED